METTRESGREDLWKRAGGVDASGPCAWMTEERQIFEGNEAGTGRPGRMVMHTTYASVERARRAHVSSRGLRNSGEGLAECAVRGTVGPSSTGVRRGDDGALLFDAV